MSFLQPWMLWGLFAASLPIIIHLLNRLRFRTVKWAAMMFLARAARSSTRHARLRQWLILACRTLAVLLFVLALCRPIAGGWLGMSLSGAPDTIVVLLDRSASMELKDDRYRISLREQALKIFAGVSKGTESSHYVFIDSATLAPTELSGVAALPDLDRAASTDTAADIPALLRAAADYLEAHPSGRTEIWLASDFQASNWRPDSPDWTRVAARLASLPQNVRVRILAFGADNTRNRSIELRELSRIRLRGEPRLAVSLDVKKNGQASETFPVASILDGNRATFDLTVSGTELIFGRRLMVKDERGGWGSFELPSDANPYDNTVYFAYAPARTLLSLVAGTSGPSVRFLRLALAPSPVLTRSSEETAATEMADSLNANRQTALVVWQEGEPGPRNADALDQFVKSGGVVLCLPPGNADVAGPFGLQWKEAENSEGDTPYRVNTWDEGDGPLARTFDGRNLPVDRVAFTRRQRVELPVQQGEGASGVWMNLALFSDDRPFLIRHRVGKGQVFVCTSLPEREWSTMFNGLVLLPMVQRMLQDGGNRLLSSHMGVCGVWKPQGERGSWKPVDTETPKDPRFRAGVYTLGDERVAINRPVSEDVMSRIDARRAEGLLPGVPVSVADHLSVNPEKEVQVEIWRLFVYLSLAFLLAESALMLTEHVRRKSGKTSLEKGSAS